MCRRSELSFRDAACDERTGQGPRGDALRLSVSHPNLWGWDAAQHEHIFVQMVDVDQFTVTVEGVNSSDVPGDFIVSLGCSDTPYAGSGIQKSRQLAPTAQLSKRKPAHTSAAA